MIILQTHCSVFECFIYGCPLGFFWNDFYLILCFPGANHSDTCSCRSSCRTGEQYSVKLTQGKVVFPLIRLNIWVFLACHQKQYYHTLTLEVCMFPGFAIWLLSLASFSSLLCPLQCLLVQWRIIQAYKCYLFCSHCLSEQAPAPVTSSWFHVLAFSLGLFSPFVSFPLGL